MYHIPYPNKFPTLLCHVHHASRIAPPLPLPLSFSVVISLHSLSLQAQLHQILHQALLYAVYPGPLGSASILLGPCSSTPQCSQPQGGHGTGKTGNLVLTFSRQGKHREFCFDTGKNFETQGKYFSVTQGKI